MLTGFEAMVILGAWCGVVVLYAAYRAAFGRETDPIRDSGPIGTT